MVLNLESCFHFVPQSDAFVLESLLCMAKWIVGFVRLCWWKWNGFNLIGDLWLGALDRKWVSRGHQQLIPLHI
jgi:hypothetical protein